MHRHTGNARLAGVLRAGVVQVVKHRATYTEQFNRQLVGVGVVFVRGRIGVTRGTGSVAVQRVVAWAIRLPAGVVIGVLVGLTIDIQSVVAADFRPVYVGGLADDAEKLKRNRHRRHLPRGQRSGNGSSGSLRTAGAGGWGGPGADVGRRVDEAGGDVVRYHDVARRFVALVDYYDIVVDHVAYLDRVRRGAHLGQRQIVNTQPKSTSVVFVGAVVGEVLIGRTVVVKPVQIRPKRIGEIDDLGAVRESVGVAHRGVDVGAERGHGRLVRFQPIAEREQLLVTNRRPAQVGLRRIKG